MEMTARGPMLTPQIEGTAAIQSSPREFAEAFKQRVAAGLLAGRPPSAIQLSGCRSLLAFRVAVVDDCVAHAAAASAGDAHHRRGRRATGESWSDPVRRVPGHRNSHA
jgi:hypothetical protein